MLKFVVASLALFAMPLAAQEKIAVVGLVHSHVWGHLGKMVKGDSAKLVGIAETNPDLIAEAKKAGWEGPYYSDYKKMLAETKPDIVWAFTPNDEHLPIVQACAPLKIHVMFEKPLASTYKDALAINRDVSRSDVVAKLVLSRVELQESIEVYVSATKLRRVVGALQQPNLDHRASVREAPWSEHAVTRCV